MSVKIGHASIDENGKIAGGQEGDQNGRELCIRDWYSKPWAMVLRCSDTQIADKMAAACEAACGNENIGYDQSRRGTLYTQALIQGHDIAKIKNKCSCDCSSLISECAIAAGVFVPSYLTTATMERAFLLTGIFTALKDSRYTASDSELKRGDILLKPGSHTAMVLSRSRGSSAKPAPVMHTAKLRDAAKSGRYKVTAGVLNARYGPGVVYDKIKTLKRGQIAACYGYYEGEWLYCDLPGGGVGWVSGKWLEKLALF